MSAGLPRPVTRLLARCLPSRVADEVIDAVAEEHASRVRRQGRPHAALWVAGEVTRLVVAGGSARLAAAARTAPLVARDARSVVRAMRRRPVASLSAAGMLAVGLAAAAAAWGLDRALIDRPVSVSHGEALRRLAALDPGGRPLYALSFAEFEVIERHLAPAVTLAAVNLQPAMLRRGTASVQTLAEVVTAEHPALVGGVMAVGRPLIAADARSGAPPVAVISERLWRDRLGADPDIVGASITANTTSFTVVGVARSLGSSSLLGASVDVWISVAHGDAVLNPGWRTDPADRWWRAFALPGEGGVPALDARLRLAEAGLAQAIPEPWRARRLASEAAFALEGRVRATASALTRTLAALALLILAIAAANVGGLDLARAAADNRQMAVRLSLGASRRRLIGHRLAEGALVGGAGGAGALALYAWIRVWMAEVALQPTLALRVELPVSAALVATAVGTGVVLGVLLASGPAVWSTRMVLIESLKDGSARAGGRGVSRARRGLVAAQVALSLVLIIGAGLFTRSLDALARVDAGFPRAGLAAMDFDVEPTGPGTMDVDALAREALHRTRALPGVRHAAFASRAPVDPSTPGTTVRRPGEETPIGEATYLSVTDAYFDTVGIPLLRGRDFTAQEVERDDAVAVVNDRLARELWSDQDAIGRALVLDRLDRTYRVVGVARDAKYRSLAESGGWHVYVPTAPRFGLALLMRSDGDARATLRAVQAVLDQVGPGLVGFFPRTEDDHLAPELLPSRLASRAATSLGLVALLLSTTGLYALVMWFVETRRREIGLRMALGASRRAVALLVVRQALAAAMPGAMVGLLLAAGLGAATRSLLFGVAPADPLAFGAGLCAVLLVVGVASFVPSRAATRVDPAAVLRD